MKCADCRLVKDAQLGALHQRPHRGPDACRRFADEIRSRNDLGKNKKQVLAQHKKTLYFSKY